MTVKAVSSVTVSNVYDGITYSAACSTDAATAAKVVDLAGFTLESGKTIAVNFTNGNTVASPTLNVNETGAKHIILNNAAYAYWMAGSVILFIYDGTVWQACNFALYGATATIGNPSGGNVYTDSNSVSIRNSSTEILKMLAVTLSRTNYSMIKSATNNLCLMCPDNGAVCLGTYDPSTGAQSDFGIGLYNGVARFVADSFTFNEYPYSLETLTTAATTDCPAGTWKVLHLAGGLKLAMGNIASIPVSFSEQLDNTWYRSTSLPIPLPSGVFTSKPFAGFGGASNLASFAASSYANWTSSLVRFDVYRGWSGTYTLENAFVMVVGI